MSLGKCIQLCDHNCNQEKKKENLCYPKKVPCCLFIVRTPSSSQAPGHLFHFLLLCFAFSRISRKQNHTLRSLLRQASLTRHDSVAVWNSLSTCTAEYQSISSRSFQILPRSPKISPMLTSQILSTQLWPGTKTTSGGSHRASQQDFKHRAGNHQTC